MSDGHPVLTLRPDFDAQPSAEGETDRNLLERFADGADETAFSALVARHGAVVRAACRRVLRHEQDAEDAFQATFVVLASKAGAVRWECSVRRWLLAVAYRLSLRARGPAIRRRLREKPLETALSCEDKKSHPPGEVEHRELQEIVAGELACLPEKYREPVVLCYLEGKTNEEAAGELGWPTGSMSGRLARARALLRQRLARRGLALLVVLVVGSLTALGVKQAVQPSKPERTVAHGHGIEDELRRLADGAQPGPDRARLSQMAWRTALAASELEGQAPPHRQKDWRTFSTEMRASALDLAAALDAGPDRAVAPAALRLTASCRTCHEAFRD